jgi:apolipoprotein N-acyltransferase
VHPAARPRLTFVAWMVFAILAGVAWAACFGNHPQTLLAWGGLAPLVVLARHRRAGLLAFLHGFTSWLISLWWIPPTLVTFGKIPFPVALVLGCLLAAYLALYHVAFVRYTRYLSRRLGTAALFIAVPAGWVALEWLRTYVISGFPWNVAAYSWVDMPGALPLSAWIGAAGVSGLLVVSACGIAWSATRVAERQPRAWAPLAPAFLIPLLLFSLAGRWSLRHSRFEAEQTREAGLPVELLQPNIRAAVSPDPRQVMSDYFRVLAQSEDACSAGTLVVWPEGAAWPFEIHRDSFLDRDLRNQTARGCTILVNSEAQVNGLAYNSLFDLSPRGELARYDKRHLVPFGEYVPFRSVFFFMERLARSIGDFHPAREIVLLPWRGEKLGAAICYEAIFAEEVAATTQAGATLLVTVTNDSWYGDTAAPGQHFRAVRFRAAENRRTFLRAAITGVSALVEPDGSVPSEIGVFEQGVIRARVKGETMMTLFARAPRAVPLTGTLLSIAAIYWARRRARS